MVNEVSRWKSAVKAKLKAASQEEQIHLWKRHFENLLRKPPKVTHEPITKIISNQLDIQLGQFTQELLDSVLRKIKNHKLCQILEGLHAKNLELTMLFVDFSRAFDSIHRGKMEQILVTYGLPKETIAAIMMLYKNMKVKVRSPNGDTDYFDVVAGVLQGNISPIPVYYLSRLHA